MMFRVALLLSFTLFACADPAPAAWLERAQSAHRAVDQHGATEALESFVDAPVPEGIDESDRAVVLKDSFYRLGRAALESDDAEQAQRYAERGLELGREADVFTANLLIVRGEAREALGEAVDAAADYHEALIINDALLQQALQEGEE